MSIARCENSHLSEILHLALCLSWIESYCLTFCGSFRCQRTDYPTKLTQMSWVNRSWFISIDVGWYLFRDLFPPMHQGTANFVFVTVVGNIWRIFDHLAISTYGVMFAPEKCWYSAYLLVWVTKCLFWNSDMFLTTSDKGGAQYRHTELFDASEVAPYLTWKGRSSECCSRSKLQDATGPVRRAQVVPGESEARYTAVRLDKDARFRHTGDFVEAAICSG